MKQFDTPPPKAAPKESLGYRFQHPELLTRAMTHKTFRVERPDVTAEDNETLEFLGDAVLDLVIGAMLFVRYPAMQEGDLTKLRSTLVQERHLAVVAGDLGLGDHIRLGRGEDLSGGRHKASILASAYEALIGAIFLDSDYSTVQHIVEGHFQDRIDAAQKSVASGDAKSALQELTQERFNAAPSYILDKAEGPDHAKTFTVSVHLQGRHLASAAARNKKTAEQQAAAAALEALGSA